MSRITVCGVDAAQPVFGIYLGYMSENVRLYGLLLLRRVSSSHLCPLGKKRRVQPSVFSGTLIARSAMYKYFKKYNLRKKSENSKEKL